MRALLLSLALTALSSVSVQAQTSDLESLNTLDGARGWEAVGRLDINGKGFCTGALIAPDLVLTAAHCMYDDTGGGAVDPSRIEFLAGLRGGRPEATRSVRTAVVHPSYRHSDGDATNEQVRYDVALLQLYQPIRSARVTPFEVSTSARTGTEVSVISYAQDRDQAPSLQEDCNVIGEQDGVLFMDCDVNFGASGSPVFSEKDGVRQLVSVVSAMAQLDGERVALAMNLAEPLAVLRLALEDARGGLLTTPTTARIVRQGERNDDTGALFVRP